MTSEMMKSSIPSIWASTRELRFAGGGPWCSPAPPWVASPWAGSAWATGWGMLAASMKTRPLALAARGGGRRGRGFAEVDHDVLDRDGRRVADALDQVRAHPARALVGERRDHDVVDAEQLEGVHRGGVGIG